MKLVLGSLREDAQYGAIEICFEKPRLEAESELIRGETGIFLWVFLLKLDTKLKEVPNQMAA